MKVDAVDRKIEKIFQKKIYTIPDYQRNYSWERNIEVKTFWEDLLQSIEPDENGLFIGSMVFKGETLDSDEYEVIDGQQRLITVAIFFSVLVDIFEQLGETTLAENLQPNLVFNDTDGESHLTIVTEEPHPFFQNKIFHRKEGVKPERASEKKIEDTRSFLRAQILDYIKDNDAAEKLEVLKKIRNGLLDVSAVIVVSSDEVSAFSIFETINTRGKSLNSLDLLKNYVFKNYVRSAGVDEPKKSWSLFAERIDGDDDFFNRFWSSHVEKVSEKNLYKKFLKNMKGSDKHPAFENTEDLLTALIKGADAYRKIISPKLDDWKENKNYDVYYSLKNIYGLFRVKVHIPFVLALVEEFDAKKLKISKLREALEIIENFHFIFSHVMSLRPSGLDKKYSKFAVKIRKAKNKSAVIEELKKELGEKIPNEDVIKDALREYNFIDNSDSLKYILLRLEKQVRPESLIDIEKHSIDHLYPKSKSKKAWVNQIGNLCLLEKNLNEIKDDKQLFDTLKLGDKKTKMIEYILSQTSYQGTRTELEFIKKLGAWGEVESTERLTRVIDDIVELLKK